MLYLILTYISENCKNSAYTCYLTLFTITYMVYLQYCIDWAKIHSEKAVSCRIIHKIGSHEKRIAVLKFLKASLLEKFVRPFKYRLCFKKNIYKKILCFPGTEWFIVYLLISGRSMFWRSLPSLVQNFMHVHMPEKSDFPWRSGKQGLNKDINHWSIHLSSRLYIYRLL